MPNRALRERRIRELYDSFAVTDDLLEAGLANRTLALDTRRRDALWTLGDADGGFRLPAQGKPPALSFPRPDVSEDAAYAAEASVLVEIEGIVRAGSRVEAPEDRIADLESRPLARWP